MLLRSLALLLISISFAHSSENSQKELSRCNLYLSSMFDDSVTTLIKQKITKENYIPFIGRIEEKKTGEHIGQGPFFLYLKYEQGAKKEFLGEELWRKLYKPPFLMEDKERTLKEVFKVDYEKNLETIEEGDFIIATKNGFLFFATQARFAQVEIQTYKDKWTYMLAPDDISPDKWLEALSTDLVVIVLKRGNLNHPNYLETTLPN